MAFLLGSYIQVEDLGLRPGNMQVVDACLSSFTEAGSGLKIVVKGEMIEVSTRTRLKMENTN